MKNLIIILSVLFLTVSCKSTDSESTTATTPTEPVVIQNYQKLESFKLNGNKSIVLTPDVQADQAMAYDGPQMSLDAVMCNGANPVDDLPDAIAQNTEICIDELELHPLEMGYVNYRPTEVLPDATADIQVAFDGAPNYHAVFDSSGDVHHFDRAPTRQTGFTNSKMVEFLPGKVRHLSSGDWIEKDLSSDSEVVLRSGVKRFHRVGERWLTVGDSVFLGDVEIHYFAGYGGGRKSILPGISHYSTIQHNYKKNFFHHASKPGVLDGNPMYENMTEGARLANPNFCLNIVG